MDFVFLNDKASTSSLKTTIALIAGAGILSFYGTSFLI